MATEEQRCITTTKLYSLMEDVLTYGIEWDITVANPNCIRIGNPVLHKSLPIQSQLRGCIATGNKIKYYLDPNNWAYKEDGSASVLDGTDGEVKVHIPKFYGKSGSNGNKRWVRISTIRLDNSWVEIPEMLIDAYRLTVNNTTNKAASVVNTSAEYRGGGNRSNRDTLDSISTDLGKPRTAIGRPTARTWVKNKADGSALLNYEYYKWVMYWLPVIEFANFNMQATYIAEPTSEGYKQGGLGTGLTTLTSAHWSEVNGYYPLTPNGYTNEFGNFTGIKNITIPATTNCAAKTSSVCRYRGFENLFGDIWTDLDGVLIVPTADTSVPRKVYTSVNSKDYNDSDYSSYRLAGEEIQKEGYITTFDLGEQAEIIPSAVGGGSTIYKCDYHYVGSINTTIRTLLVGGSAYSWRYCWSRLFRFLLRGWRL